MITHETDFEMYDLQPFRMPTDTLENIDQLSEERRRLLQELSAQPLDPGIKARMREIDEQLDELWLQRRLELRHTG